MQKLHGIETNKLISIDVHEWFSSYLKFWTSFAPRVLFLQILCKVLFKNILQIVKGTWIRLKKAFSRFENFSPVSNAFPLTKTKLPLNKILLLVFKRVLQVLKILLSPPFEHNKISIWKLHLKLVVVRSFCFGLILFPPLAWIAKNGYLWVKYKPFNFLPNGK